MFNLDSFIIDYITRRRESLFRADLDRSRETLIREISGKPVLVIGGAGTIGSSFIKVLLRYGPSRLIVADISENGLTELTRDLRSTPGLSVPVVYKTYPVNFGDPVFERILKAEGPFSIVANFAAHKHVRSEKDEFSITALLENNVIKAERLLRLLSGEGAGRKEEGGGINDQGGRTHGSSPTDVLSSSLPHHFFCVSTDKAANPASIMGASKKVMEELIMAYSHIYPVTTARFANVAFSQGSLPDGWMQRMAKRQPLVAPSDVKRYFVSPEESGEICLLACILGKSGDIFFPKLEEAQMMTFSDIAMSFLQEQGYEPWLCSSEEEAKAFLSDELRVTSDSAEATVTGNWSLEPAPTKVGVTSPKYPVYFFQSDTSGEKSFEEFYVPGEEVDLTTYESLGVIKNARRRPLSEVRTVLARLVETLSKPGIAKSEIVSVLAELVPGFEHVETGRSLDQKM